jgi:hypothetical protein
LGGRSGLTQSTGGAGHTCFKYTISQTKTPGEAKCDRLVFVIFN